MGDDGAGYDAREMDRWASREDFQTRETRRGRHVRCRRIGDAFNVGVDDARQGARGASRRRRARLGARPVCHVHVVRLLSRPGIAHPARHCSRVEWDAR